MTLSLFKERCELAGGAVYDLDSPKAAANLVLDLAPEYEDIFIHPELEEFFSGARVTRVIDDKTPPPGFDSKCLGIVSAKLGVAETGSVVLLEKARYETQLNTLSSTLLVLLKADLIQPDLPSVNLHLKELMKQGWITFMTGVSCTGDIEMVTVKGIQGPEELLVGVYGAGKI